MADVVEQVIVKFIADNASYLRDIKTAQDALIKYQVYSTNILEKIEKNTARLATGYNKVTQATIELGRAQEKTAQIQMKTQAYMATLNNQTLNGMQKIVAIQSLMGTQFNKTTGYQKTFHTEGSRGAMSMFQHYTNLGAQLGFLVRQYVGLFAVIRSAQTVIREGFDFKKFQESTTIAFGVMMKSVDAAKAKMQELYDFAVKSPLTFKEVAKSSKQLMAYGFQSEELVGTMRMLGTVSKAVGVSMDDMAYTYGTLRSQGRAYSRDLLQFAMRGIPIYEELANVLGVHRSKIKQLVEDGKIGFRDIEKAFINMTSAGGKFDGMLSEWMKTMEGQLSMLTDMAQQASGQFVDRVFERMKVVIKDLIELMGTSGFKDFVADAAQAFGLLVEALIKAIEILIKLRGPLTFLLTVFVASKLAASIVAAGKAIFTFASLFQGATLSIANATAALSLMGASFNPVILAVTALIALLPGLIKLLDDAARERTMEIKAKTTAGAQALAGEFFKMMPGVDPFMEKQRETISYYSAIENLAKKYELPLEYVTEELFTQKAITKERRNQVLELQKIINTDKNKFASTFTYKGAGKVQIPEIAEFISERTGIAIENILKPLYEDEKGTILKGYTVLAKGAVRQYIEAFETEAKAQTNVIDKIVALFGKSEQKAMSVLVKDLLNVSDKTDLEKQLKDLFSLYNELMDEGLKPEETDAYDFLIEKMKALVKQINDLDVAKDDLAKTNKALEKFKDISKKLQDEVDMNKMLGTDPTALRKLTYEFNKTIKDITEGVGDYVNMTPEQKDTLKALYTEVYNFQKAKLEELMDMAAKAGELNTENLLEQEKLALKAAKDQMDADQMIFKKEMYYQMMNLEFQDSDLKYRDAKLAFIDLEKEKAINALAEEFRAGKMLQTQARERQDMILTYYEELKRRTVEQLNLEKARLYLQGISPGAEAFWNRSILSMATKLGMKGYAYGTDGAQKGWAVVGEKGPELMYMKGGETVVPNHAIMASAKGPAGWEEQITPILDLIRSRVRKIARPLITPKTVATLIDVNRVDDLMSAYNNIPEIASHFTGGGWPSEARNQKKYSDIIKSDPYSYLKFSYGSAFANIEPALARFESYIPGTLKFISEFSKSVTNKNLRSALLNNKVSLLGFDFNNPLYDIVERGKQILDAEKGWERDWRAYATGTKGAQRGWAMVGEKGPELMYMNGGETIVPNHMINGYAAGKINEDTFQMGFPSDTGRQIAKAIGEMYDPREIAKNIAIQNAKNVTGEILSLGGEQAMGSEIGKMVAGGDPLTIALAALADFVMSIENVQKVLNPFATIFEGMGEIVKPLVNTALQPLVDLLKFVGEVIGKMLAPSLNMFAGLMKILGAIIRILMMPMEALGEAFGWLNDKVVVPFGNAVIDIINGLIKGMNKLPFIEIAYLDHLQTIEEITKQDELLTKGNQSLTDTVAYLNDKLKKEVDKQIKSYQDLYDLGLITATEYETKVAAANALIPDQESLISAADKALTSVTEIADRIKQLTAIQLAVETGKYTDPQVLQMLKNAGLVTTPTAPEYLPPSEIVTAKVEVPVVVTEEVPKIVEMAIKADRRRKDDSYASGTSYVPSDMSANIHRGEIIVPKTFSDSIRNGEMVLGNTKSTGSVNYNVVVNVEGSVTSERDLTISIAKAIQKQTVRGYV